MNIERSAMRGQIAVKEHRLGEIKLESSALVLSIRQKLAPYVDVDQLEMDAIKIMTDRLRELHLESKLIISELSKLEEALNG